MEGNRRPPEFAVSLHVNPASAKDMIKGVLHTIFFHRTFTAIRPLDRDVLGVTLPLVDDADLETLIDARATALVRQIESAVAHQHHYLPGDTGTGGNGTPVGRGQLAVQFFERRRRKTYFFGKSADEEVCWEQWNVDVTVSRAKNDAEADRLRETLEESLQNAAMQVINIVGLEKNHIPPITTQDVNPFPYQIILREQGWGKAMGLF